MKRMKLFVIALIISLAIISIVTISTLISIGTREVSPGDIKVDFEARGLDKDGMAPDGDLVAGKEVLLTFRITDNNTGKPVPGLRPEVRFYSPGEHDPANEHQHSDGYHFTNEVRMARLKLFVLNSERGTLEVLDTFGNYDPRPSAIRKLGVMTSKVIRLTNSPGQKTGDLLPGRYGNYIYASLPGENRVAVVNTILKEVVRYIDVGLMPDRMFLEPHSKYLWAGNNGSISIIDTDNNIHVKTIETGKGYHQVAFSPENAYVTNSEENIVSVIRLGDFTKYVDIEAGNVPYGIDYSNATNEVYVTNTIQGTLDVIDAGTNLIKRHVPLEKGIETIKFSPDGRWGIVLNRHENTAYMIDAASTSLIKTVKTGEAPSDVGFMAEYALIRNTFSNDVTYVSMTDPDISNTVAVGIEPTLARVPHSLITSSYGDEAVITSPREGKVYFMHRMNGEPMVMDSADVEYGSDAAAIVENKLYETSPGTYQQYIILEEEGPYDIELRAPGINASYKIHILPAQAKGPVITSLFKDISIAAGKNLTLQYLIEDRKTGQPEGNLTDLMFMVIKPGKEIRTQRVIPRYIGGGVYEINITFAEAGDYMVTLTSDILNNEGYDTIYDYITVKNAVKNFNTN